MYGYELPSFTIDLFNDGGFKIWYETRSNMDKISSTKPKRKFKINKRNKQKGKRK